MILVVDDLASIDSSLMSLGYVFKGEYNIPCKKMFDKKGTYDVHLHVFEEGHPEIALNLCFRDYLRTHPERRDAYAALKEELAAQTDSFTKKEGKTFTNYTHAKHGFIQETLKLAGFTSFRMVFCAHDAEWEAVHYFRNHYFFEPNQIDDPYRWTFDHPDHRHFMLYQGIEIVGYAHLQLWPEQRSALRMIVVDEKKRGQGIGKSALSFIENWLRLHGYHTIHTESSPAALTFYEQLGYKPMAFHDPDGYESSPEDIPLGKVL